MDDSDGPVKFGHFKIDHQRERQLQLAGIGVSLLGVALFFLSHRASTQAAAATTNPDGTTATTVPGGSTTGAVPSSVDPSTLLSQELTVAEDQIGHSATFAFNLASNAATHNIGTHQTSGGGGGGVSLFGISIGGSGGKTGTDTWDLSNSEAFNSGLGGSNLSESEFDLLVQQSQALSNTAAEAQDAEYQSSANNLAAFKSGGGGTGVVGTKILN